MKLKLFSSIDDVDRHYFPRRWRENHPRPQVGTGFAEDFLRRVSRALGVPCRRRRPTIREIVQGAIDDAKRTRLDGEIRRRGVEDRERVCRRRR